MGRVSFNTGCGLCKRWEGVVSWLRRREPWPLNISTCRVLEFVLLLKNCWLEAFTALLVVWSGSRHICIKLVLHIAGFHHLARWPDRCSMLLHLKGLLRLLLDVKDSLDSLILLFGAKHALIIVKVDLSIALVSVVWHYSRPWILVVMLLLKLPQFLGWIKSTLSVLAWLGNTDLDILLFVFVLLLLSDEALPNLGIHPAHPWRPSICIPLKSKSVPDLPRLLITYTHTAS